MLIISQGWGVRVGRRGGETLFHRMPNWGRPAMFRPVLTVSGRLLCFLTSLLKAFLFIYFPSGGGFVNGFIDEKVQFK